MALATRSACCIVASAALLATLIIPPTTPAAAATRDTLTPGQGLAPGQALVSADGRYSLVMQASDGNLVLYAPDRPLWSSRTAGNPGASVVLQRDGNLVVYRRDGHPIWHSVTYGQTVSHLIVQNDANIVLYRPDRGVAWSSWTAGGQVSAWDRLAQCESTSRWHLNTGNGYYGGLQFSLATWQWVGGTGYPHHASPAEQIYRGTLLHARRGWQPWPTCSSRLGLR